MFVERQQYTATTVSDTIAPLHEWVCCVFHRISQFSFDSAFFCSLAVFVVVVVVVLFSLDRRREVATESERRQLS